MPLSDSPAGSVLLTFATTQRQAKDTRKVVLSPHDAASNFQIFLSAAPATPSPPALAASHRHLGSGGVVPLFHSDLEEGGRNRSKCQTSGVFKRPRRLCRLGICRITKHLHLSAGLLRSEGHKITQDILLPPPRPPPSLSGSNLLRKPTSPPGRGLSPPQRIPSVGVCLLSFHSFLPFFRI